jgi:hypothetical protein
MNFSELVEELSELLGMELVIDKNKVVQLILDRKIKMHLEFHSFKESFCIIFPIDQLYQGMRREEVLKAALKSNHTFRPYGGHFGFVEKKGVLVLFCYIPQSSATAQKVFDEMVLLSKQARSWIEALGSGQNAPQGAFEEPNLPRTSIFGAFNRK